MKSSSNFSKRILQNYFFIRARPGQIKPQVNRKQSKYKFGYSEFGPMLVRIFFLLIVARTTLVVRKSDSSCGRGRMFGFPLTQRVALGVVLRQISCQKNFAFA